MSDSPSTSGAVPPIAPPTSGASPVVPAPVLSVTRRAWVVWSVGVAAYVVAVLQRTSFGVAGLDAADRFHAAASVLSVFTVLQLLVYAALQIPTGLLLDRFGSRRMVAAGALLMAGGQVLLAVGDSVPLAVLGRVVVGAGDALTFVSVLRLVPAWFPARRVPVITQMTGTLGQLGQVLSAVPLVALLAGPGWTTAFLSAAAAGVLVAVLTMALVRDAPGVPVHVGHPMSFRQAGRDLASAWRHPGTRLGLWTHFSTQFPGTVFALMWGFPFLVAGEGQSVTAASTLITLYVVATAVASPVLGVLTQRHPLRRSWLVLTTIGVNIAGWTAVLAHDGPAPTWLLVLLVLALATGGPGSIVGFDYARSSNPAQRLGTATGIVNVGGFVASLVVVLMIGISLDLTGDGEVYDLDGFRTAFSSQYLLWAVGITGILVTRRQVRRRMASEGVVVPPVRRVVAESRARRSAARQERRSGDGRSGDQRSGDQRSGDRRSGDRGED